MLRKFILEVFLALVTVAAIAYVIVNNDMVPGLKDKWQVRSQIIQNNLIN